MDVLVENPMLVDLQMKRREEVKDRILQFVFRFLCVLRG